MFKLPAGTFQLEQDFSIKVTDANGIIGVAYSYNLPNQSGVDPVPEPATLALLGLGLAGLGFSRRKQA